MISVAKTGGILKAFTEVSLSLRIEQVMDRTSQDVWCRAASFLVLADSRASFAIEGERSQYLPDLMQGLLESHRIMSEGQPDPVMFERIGEYPQTRYFLLQSIACRCSMNCYSPSVPYIQKTAGICPSPFRHEPHHPQKARIRQSRPLR
ncbi:MAG: hypothetical protein WCG61_05070, partial [Chlorobium sp.]